MSDFYKPYPKEFYALNKFFPEEFLEKQPQLAINTINFTDRCINYNAIDPTRRMFNPEVFRNVLQFLAKNEDRFQRYIDFVFPTLEKDRHQAILKNIIQKDPQRFDDKGLVELHYFLVDLYFSFPNHPHRFLNGILRKIETRLAKNGIRYRYVIIDMDKERPFVSGFPWARLRFFSHEDGNDPMAVPTDDSDNKSQCILADQLNLTILDCASENETGTLDEESAGEESYQDPSRIFSNYLSPLFINPEFDGKDEYEAIERFPYWSFIVYPLYSVNLPVDGPHGAVIGHLFLSFRDEAERKDYTQSMADDFDHDWDFRSALILNTIMEGRTHFAGENGFQHNESLKCLIENIAHIQDWERVLVFENASSLYPKYCFKRFYEDGDDFKERWRICDNKKCEDCTECNLGYHDDLIEKVRSYLKQYDSANLETEPTCLEAEDHCFFFKPMNDILDPNILPAIEIADIAKYQNYILCFQFPEHTFFPIAGTTLQNAIGKLGNYYFKKLIPIFDRVLMKHKVLKHSLKSAVAAIISRNHSHHIGSHVSPRATVDRVTERLTALKVFSDDIDKIPKKSEAEEQARELDRRLHQLLLSNAVVDRLKSDLDGYIQKKADFSAEIATEPVISTKSALFFSEVILPFSGNSLLVDNLGANEGVRYTSADESRIQFRLLMEGEETEAWFGGQSRSCNCPPAPHRKRPYTGTCTCLESTLQLVAPYPPDRSVALPGPLGEFAVYSFLENLIRNSVKHNRSWFQQDPRHRLEISINLSEIRDESPLCATHLLCEVWDNVTDLNIKRQLKEYAQRSLIDDQGCIVPDGWGLAEMRIMASLLRGERSFTRPLTDLELISVKPKNGADTLVYQFYLMKCRQIALVQEGIVVPDTMQYHGIHGFNTLEELLGYQKYSHSPAAFEFVFFSDGQETVSIGKSLAQLPSRLLMVDQAGETVPGICHVGTVDAVQIMAAVESADPEWLIQLCWQLWLEHLRRRHEYQNPRLMLFFQQSRNESPTREWYEIAKKRSDRVENPFSISMIYCDGDSNRTEPSLDEKGPPEDLFFFDRHFASWISLSALRERFRYHHALDKNSADFVPIMAAAPSWVTAQRLCEAAMLRVLVLDERVAEVAYDQLFQGDPKAARLYRGRERLRVGKWANIFIATHICAQGADPVPLHPSIDSAQYPRVCLKLDTRSVKREVPIFEVCWCPDATKECDHCKVTPVPGTFDVLILHYGLLEGDGLLQSCLNGFTGETLTQKANRFFEGLKPNVPQVVIDSGRGIPAHMPAGVRFLPYSVIEAHLLKKRLSKFSLTGALMGLTQNRG